jgi:SAM-dependent methyltransferase
MIWQYSTHTGYGYASDRRSGPYGLELPRVLLADTRERTPLAPGIQVGFLSGNFHQLPLHDRSCALTGAASCLCRSPRPAQAISEIARVLARAGLAALITKSLDSYRDTGTLIAAASLDHAAGKRESLSGTEHGGSIPGLREPVPDAIAIEHKQRSLTFPDLSHAGKYLATSPRCDLVRGLHDSPPGLAATLRARHPHRRITTSPVVTFVARRRRGGPR